MPEWFFSAPDAWELEIDDAPNADEALPWFERAVPSIVARMTERPDRPPQPCVVVAHTTVLTAGAPLGGAKPLLDCLHDYPRRRGPKYGDLGLVPPLGGDEPDFVSGLAVEVRRGSHPHTHWLFGDRLTLAGPLVRDPVDVQTPVPNWAGADERELASQRALQTAYDDAVRVSRSASGNLAEPSDAMALVIRHRRQRDEDNSWPGWLGGLRRALASSDPRWSRWQPTAIASVVDNTLPCPVRYEFYAAA